MLHCETPLSQHGPVETGQFGGERQHVIVSRSAYLVNPDDIPRHEARQTKIYCHEAGAVISMLGMISLHAIDISVILNNVS